MPAAGRVMDIAAAMQQFSGRGSIDVLRERCDLEPGRGAVRTACHPEDGTCTMVSVGRHVWGVDRARRGQVRTRVAARGLVGALSAVDAAKPPMAGFLATVGALSS
jgi:hypothetical protein